MKGQRDLSQTAKQVCNPCIFEVSIKDNDVRCMISKFLLSNPSILFTELQEIYNKEGESFNQRTLVIALEMMWSYL